MAVSREVTRSFISWSLFALTLLLLPARTAEKLTVLFTVTPCRLHYGVGSSHTTHSMKKIKRKNKKVSRQLAEAPAFDPNQTTNYPNTKTKQTSSKQQQDHDKHQTPSLHPPTQDMLRHTQTNGPSSNSRRHVSRESTSQPSSHLRASPCPSIGRRRHILHFSLSRGRHPGSGRLRRRRDVSHPPPASFGRGSRVPGLLACGTR